MHAIPTIRLKRLKRTALLFGAGALVAGASVLGATQAQAALGTQAQGVQLSPASGATTGATITYSSSACPSGFQGSGLLRIVDPATSGISNLAPVNNSVASAFTGTLTTNVLNLEATSVFTDLAGTQAEIAMYCFSGASATGSSEPVQYTFITISSDASSYVANQTQNAGPVSTTTTLTASPSPATVGSTVTLTANVSPSNAVGTVQFEVGGTAINTTPATVTNGVATTTTSFAAAGTEALSAVFTPTSTTAFTSSTGTASLTVTTAQVATGTIPLSVTVPSSGTFSLTVDSADTVTLTATTAGTDATAATTPIVVSDTRNTYPGWSATGQDPNGFTGSGSAAGATMSGNQLGWTPTNSGTLPQGVTLGSAVAPASPGLGTTPAVLASVHAGLGNGYGTSTLGANLDLLFPVPQAAGPYTGGLTITAVGANP